jgi:Tfp pilus assembly protein PilN
VGRLILWLVVLSLGFLFLPLYLLLGMIDQNNTALQVEISTLQAELDRGPLPSANEQELQDALSAALENISVVQPMRSQLEDNRIDWPAVAASISNYHDDYMVVLGLSQAGHQLALSGRAWDEQTVLSYAGRLEESGYFNKVLVQSLSANIVPTATPPRGTPTPTAEPPGAASPPTLTPSRIKYVEFIITAELKAPTP